MGYLALGENSRHSVKLLSSASLGNLLTVRGQTMLPMQHTRLAGLPLTSHFA